MRARISDPEVFQGLSHIDVRAYLAAQGWKESDRIGNKALVFIKKDSDGKDWEILLPTRSDLGDYAQRMAEALHYVALLEHRSELAVLNDLQLSGFDVVRVRISHAEEVGTISVVVGVGLLRHARNMLLASACAAIMPRPVYHARRPDKASQYLASVRLGQTERGSYVVPLLSPVGPALRLQARQPKLAPEYENEPFERQVTRVLAESLTALHEAASEAAATDTFEPFEKKVPNGVSADLCEAVAGLCHATPSVDIGISWALVRPAPIPGYFRVSFSKDTARILEEAAREFRANEPELDYVVTGWVTTLDREPHQIEGKAVLDVLIDNKPRRVAALFGPQDYSLVVKAHEERLPISCEGDLYRFGRRYELRNPRGLTLRPITDDDSERLANADLPIANGSPDS